MKRIIIAFFVLFTYVGGNCQSEVSLKGMELMKANELESAIESGIGLIFGAGRLNGNIDKVIVTDETYKDIKVKVLFSGFEGNWLKGSLIGETKAEIGGISKATMELAPGSGEVEMTFSRAEETDAVMESSYLKLMVCREEKNVTGRVNYYILQKKWKPSGISEDDPDYSFINESLVINIDPAPVGVASNLKDIAPGKPLPVPAGKHVMKGNDAIYESRIQRQSMLVGAAILSLETVSQPADAVEAKDTSPKFEMLKYQIRPLETVSQPADAATKKDFSPKIAILHPDLSRFNLNKEEIDRGALGPGNTAISLWDEIRCDPQVDFDFSHSYKITNINFDIFPDQNENSGYYYYFPTSYSLHWDRENSYRFRILYGSKQETEEGMVNMFMTITPKVSSGERRMVEKLVQDYTVRNNKPFEKLRPLPCSDPVADLTGILTKNYDVPADKIHTTGTGIFDPIQVSWQISTRKADDLMIALKEIDLRGNLLLQPQGELSDINIPINIAFGDDQTFGRIILQNNIWRNQMLKNEMPFPIRLRYIHALILNKEESGSTTPYIYSWDLNSQDVPVLSSVQFNASLIPSFVDTDAERIWVEYTVPECKACMDKVINDLTGGTISSRQQKIEIVSYGILERTNALVIEVTVRSLYVDPQGRTIKEIIPLRIMSDNEYYSIGPLYVPEEKTLVYEYKMKMVTDKEELTSEWIYSTETSLYLTRNMVEAALGKFPEKDE